MEITEQLKQCKKCKNQEFSRNQGIICQLTKEKPNFEGICPSFVGENKDEEPGKINSEKAYKVKDAYANRQIITGYILLAISIIVVVLSAKSFFLLLSSTYVLFLGYKQKDREAITLFEKYLEFKVTPVSPVARIKYGDITKVGEVTKNKMMIYGTVNGKPGKKARLPLVYLSDNDKNDLLKRLNAQLVSCQI